MIKQIHILLALVVLTLVASTGYWYGFSQGRPQVVSTPVAVHGPVMPPVDLSGDPMEIFISRDSRYAKASEITQKDVFWNHYKNFENGFELDVPRFVWKNNIVIYEDGSKIYLSDEGLFEAQEDQGPLDWQGVKLSTGVTLHGYNIAVYSEGQFQDLASAKKYVVAKHGVSCKMTTSKKSEARDQITITDNRTTVLGEYLDSCDTGRAQVYYFYDVNSGRLWRDSDSRTERQAPSFFEPTTWCPKGNPKIEGCSVSGPMSRSFTTFK